MNSTIGRKISCAGWREIRELEIASDRDNLLASGTNAHPSAFPSSAAILESTSSLTSLPMSTNNI
jgi:hypothetical protein